MIARSAVSRDPPRRLVVGLLNNMSEGAFEATDRQFTRLLKEAAGPDVTVCLRRFVLPDLGGPTGRRHGAGAGGLSPSDSLPTSGLDALIVTGAEPRAAQFDDEVYWSSLAKVIDWTEAAGVPVAWSCLAAHAAVWRLQGVPRRRLATKRSGLFGLSLIADSPLLQGAPTPAMTPHSRWNDLDGGDLERAGYEILTRLEDGTVDAFVGRAGGAAPSLYFQGHPEYAADTLEREYLRDVSRFLRGLTNAPPGIPVNYFDAGAVQTLSQLSDQALSRPAPELLEGFTLAAHRKAARPWRPWALHIYRAWLGVVLEAKQRSVGVARAHEIPREPRSNTSLEVASGAIRVD